MVLEERGSGKSCFCSVKIVVRNKTGGGGSGGSGGSAATAGHCKMCFLLHLPDTAYRIDVVVGQWWLGTYPSGIVDLSGKLLLVGLSLLPYLLLSHLHTSPCSHPLGLGSGWTVIDKLEDS